MKAFITLIAALLLGAGASLALAAQAPFNQAQFDADRGAGKPVAVVFHADWCPTCRAQAPVLKELAASPQLQSLTVYVANFDTEKALRSSLGVNQQSTIVVFKGNKETGRSTGETQRQALASFLQKAIS